MGNHNSRHSPLAKNEGEGNSILRRNSSKKQQASVYVPALEKLFQKLELTSDVDNGHPGEITRKTFENVFHGPLHSFGSLMYRQMVTNGSYSADKVKDRISCEQFVKSGKEVLKLFEEVEQHKYYFKLFSSGNEYLTSGDALIMVNIAYALTLSSSMIPYSKTAQDDKVFESVVYSMFGMKLEIKYGEMEKWLQQNCPHMFSGVHNWVYTILTGSKMPSELEAATVPLLEQFTEGQHLLTMSMVWLLTATLPYAYTHNEKDDSPNSPNSPTGTKNPLLTSFQFLMKLVRLSRCQSWTMLYDSDENGLSVNRFSHHVTAYNKETLTLISFEGRNIYCLAQDIPWREDCQHVGGADAQLIQITPLYRVILAGGGMTSWNVTEHNSAQGISIEQQGKATIMHIPKDFDTVRHYGVDCVLQRVEVWGCGGRQAFQTQQKHKQWERKEVEKHKSRKLHLDTNWDENPDRQILSWGGVEVNHQYSQGGAM